jgi:hypothetical protein
LISRSIAFSRILGTAFVHRFLLDAFHRSNLCRAGVLEGLDLLCVVHVLALLGLRNGFSNGFGCRSAGGFSEPHDWESFLPRRGRQSCIERFDGIDGGGGVGRDGHCAQLINFSLEKPDAEAAFDAGRLKRAETDRHRTNQAGFDRLPSFLDAVLQRAGFFDPRQRCGERYAFGGRLAEFNQADRLVVFVLPQQRQRVFERDAERFHDVANAVNGRSCGPARDGPGFLRYGLDLEKTVGSVHVYSSGKLRAL